MCNILILDDNPVQLGWIVDTVKGALRSFGKYRLLPQELNVNPLSQLKIPQRQGSLDDAERFLWVEELLSNVGVTESTKVDIAIVDLCLTDPPQLPDPEGIWVSSVLRKKYPKCYIIMVSSKTVTDQSDIAGGWFRYVRIPKFRIDRVVGIKDDDLTSSQSQLEKVIRQKAEDFNLIAG